MASLRSCLQSVLALHPTDVKRVNDLFDSYREAGLSPEAAAKAAATDALHTVEAERQQLVEAIGEKYPEVVSAHVIASQEASEPNAIAEPVAEKAQGDQQAAEKKQAATNPDEKEGADLSWAEVLDEAWNNGFETGNADFVPQKQHLEQAYQRTFTDAQVEEYTATYQRGARESDEKASPPEGSKEYSGESFDSDSWDKKREDRIKASKQSGAIHLDDVPASVESMRGKEIFYVHNPKQRGVIRTVDNRGNVYVYWSDKYSADKEMATEVVEENKVWLRSSSKLPFMRMERGGKTYVFQSSLGTSDLKDYVFADAKSRIDTAANEAATSPTNDTPQPSESKPDTASKWSEGTNGFTGHKSYTFQPESGAYWATVQTSEQPNSYTISYRKGDQIIETEELGGAIGGMKFHVASRVRDFAAAEKAQHIENGKTETATPSVIAASVQKSAAKTEFNPKEALSWLLGKVDEAIAEAPTAKEKGVWDNVNQAVKLDGMMNLEEAIGFKVFDVPGDGRFKVLNLKERLQAFRDNVEKSPGFRKPITPRSQVTPAWQQTGRSGTESTIRELLEDGDLTAAYEFAKQIGKPMVFGDGRDGPIVYTDARQFELDGFDDFPMVSARTFTGNSDTWAVIHPDSGLAIVSGEKTRAKAESETRKRVSALRPDSRDVMKQKMGAAKGAQESLADRWLSTAGEVEKKAQDSAEEANRRAKFVHADMIYWKRGEEAAKPAPQKPATTKPVEPAKPAVSAAEQKISDTDVAEFTAGMNALARGKATKALATEMRFDGHIEPRAKKIRALVEEGRTIETKEGQRALVGKDGSYLLESQITKTGMDFAEFLIGKKEGSKTQENEKRDDTGSDRNHFSLERLNRDTDKMEPVTFERGEYVRYLLSGSNEAFGEIDGISHAKREFSVDGLWYPFGAAYKAERQEEAKRADLVPLSSVIDKANTKHGDGLTEADRVQEKPASLIDQHAAAMDKLRDGTLSVEELKAAFALVRDNRAAIEEELSKRKKDELLRAGGMMFASQYKSDTKPEIVKGLYARMLDDFIMGSSISYALGGGTDWVNTKMKAIQARVDAATPEKLAEYAASIQKARDERKQASEQVKQAIADPKTLDDFRMYLRAKLSEGMTMQDARLSLTPEQRIQYDTLEAEASRKNRVERKEAAATDVRAAAKITDGQVIETKHTKTGEPLFVVKAADRVEREVYNQWNAAAKRLGGWYSSFRGNGAVPGFQFKTRENADAFLKFLGGDVVAAKEVIAERRDSFADDRSQSAVERLTEMADRLDERADESLSYDRKTNTARRARFAASAEAAANSDKALAQTMRNIAKAIESGTAKFLDRVRQKSQVEMLRSVIHTAKYDELKTKYPSYADQERHKGEPATAETADYAKWPTFSAYRSDLAKLARELMQIDGAKQLGQKLLKVADDVTTEYQKFAKENLHKVSTFKTQDGKPAVFPTADRAEAAIARSGFKGKATTISFKRGEHLVIMGPEMAREAGLWHGDDDKRITLTAEAGEEIVAKNKAFGKRNRLSMPYLFDNASADLARWKALGIETPAEMRSALREFIGLREIAKAPDKIKEMERAMIGRKNDGLDFFPTPAETAQAMIDAAELKEGMAVLEPSAGMGHIAEQIREAGFEPDVVEFNGDRRELLELKGFQIAGNDFMELSPRGFTYGDVFRDKDGIEGIMRGSNGLGGNRVGFIPLGKDARQSEWRNRDELEGVRKNGSNSGYDRILMNPPFSNRRDAEHVRHAYSLLKPGGRIVAIMGEGVFFGQDKKAQDFRAWLEEVGGTSEKLEEGTFLDPSLPVNTATNARMVVIDKPEGATSDNEGVGSRANRKDSISPSDKAIYGMAAEGKSSTEILKFIAASSRNPFYRQLAKLLLKTGIAPSITVGDAKGWKFNAGNDKKYAAAYNPKTDTVALFRPSAAERNMLHELVHAATIKALEKGGLSAAQMKALFAHVQKVGRAHGLFYDKATKRGIYGMSDIDEFVSEAFTNPKFQEALKKVAAPLNGGNKLSTAWHWFVRVVRGILGLKANDESALSAALEIGLGVMREDMQIRRGESGVPFSEITGREIERTLGRTLQEKATNWMRLNLQGKSFENDATGWDIAVGRKGINKAMSHGARDVHARSVAAIPDLLKHAILVASEPNNKTVDRMDIAAVHHFYAPFRMGGEVYIARMVVKETRGGQRFYDYDTSDVIRPTNQGADAHLPKEGAASRSAGREMSMANLLSHVKAEHGGTDPRFKIRHNVAEFFRGMGIEAGASGKTIESIRSDVQFVAGRDEKTGFPTWKGAHVSLSSPRDVTESHDVFYRPIGGERAVKYDIRSANGQIVGHTVLEIDGDWPTMLLDIEVQKQHRGNRYAEKAVAGIVADAGEIGIWHIVPSARSWWERIGTQTVDAHNGTLAFNDYADARASREDTQSLGEDVGRVRYNVADDGAWEVAEPSKMDDVLYALQDKHIDTKRVVQAIIGAGKKIRDAFNPYLQEELFHGRAAKGVKDFLDFELRPLLKDMQSAGVEMGDFEEYLWNRHAEERNRQVAKVNPDMKDGGSGIKTADARAYLAGLPSETKAKYEQLAKRIDAISRSSQGILVSSGLETQETIDAWNGAYQHYVPLQREDVDSGHVGTGKGFSVRGSATKRAMGSGRKVVDIIGNLTMQRERNIVRAEKNRVSNALLGLAVQNPNPEFWQVDQAPKERVVEEKAIYTVKDAEGNETEFTRMADAEKFARSLPDADIEQTWGDRVTERVIPGFSTRDNVILTRINGQDHYVVFNERNDRAMRMAQSLKNLDTDNLGRVLSVVGKATRYLASINTQYNPVFGVINLIRDAQGSLLNLSSTPLAGEQKRVLGYTVDALRGIYADIRAHRAGKVPSSNWAKLFEEFQREGGQTGYRDQYANAEDRAEAVRSELAQFKEGKAKQMVRGIFGWLSDYNETMENAVRLATYKAATEKGMSKQQAASLAKNITVNFNRKGQMATQVGALYAFFNASVQGTARIAETLFEKNEGNIKAAKLSKTGKKILAGGIMLGSMQALLLAAAGFDDDEPPEFVRERNLVMPIGDGKYLSLAMPLGFHVLPGIGRIATEFVLSGGKDPAKKAAAFFGMFVEAFNPMGSAGFSLQTITPSVVDPFAALAENKDFTGKEIYREDFNKLNPQPGHARAKDVATFYSRWISEALNFITGGSEFKPGLVSWSPDALDYLVGQATGGVGREANKVFQTGRATTTGEDLPLYKIPLAGRFIGDTEGQSGQSQKFYDAVRTLNSHENEIKGLLKQGRREEATAYRAENPESSLIMAGNHTETIIRKLRAQKRELIAKEADKEQVRTIDERISATMKGFNERYRTATGAAS